MQEYEDLKALVAEIKVPSRARKAVSIGWKECFIGFRTSKVNIPKLRFSLL